jgi:pyruvate dehydrogenase E2 component (dihydrolipoamide acetyltransferase)
VNEESAASGSPERAKGSVEIVEPGPLQQAFARRVAESKATAPHVYFERAVDVTAGLPALVKAVALALRDLPLLNGAYRDGRFELYSRINVGVGVAAQGTLVVPVIHDADTRGVDAIATQIEELTARAEVGTITSPDLAGGTFTVINMADRGVSRFTPVINRGQAATLGIGTSALTLACDNRIVQGTEGAELLDRLKAAAAA